MAKLSLAGRKWGLQLSMQSRSPLLSTPWPNADQNKENIKNSPKICQISFIFQKEKKKKGTDRSDE